jgi:hypothetical protein
MQDYYTDFHPHRATSELTLLFCSLSGNGEMIVRKKLLAHFNGMLYIALTILEGPGVPHVSRRSVLSTSPYTMEP